MKKVELSAKKTFFLSDGHVRLKGTRKGFWKTRDKNLAGEQSKCVSPWNWGLSTVREQQTLCSPLMFSSVPLFKAHETIRWEFSLSTGSIVCFIWRQQHKFQSTFSSKLLIRHIFSSVTKTWNFNYSLSDVDFMEASIWRQQQMNLQEIADEAVEYICG